MINDDVKTELKAGDVLYRTGRIEGIERVVISRVTKTMAFVERKSDGYTLVKFRRTCINGNVRSIGADSFSRISYHLETPELKEKYKRSYLVRKYKEIDPTSLTNDQLKAVLNICVNATRPEEDVNMLTVRK